MARSPSFFQRMFRSRDGQKLPPRPVPLPELVLQARTLARQLRSGPHGNRRAGDGQEFWQFRPHQPGEPASLIDWKQSARSPDPDLLWVREQEQQAPRSLHLWVDPSASMYWHSSPTLPTKHDAALSDGLALAQAALLGGEEAGIPGHRPLFAGRQALPRLAHELTREPAPPAGRDGTDPGRSARNRNDRDSTPPDLTGLPPHAALVLVSDFLWEEEGMKACLARLAARPGRTVLLAVLDPQEQHLPFHGAIRFTSCETEPALTLPATESLHDAYQARLREHFAPLMRKGRTGRMFFRFHITGQPALPVLAACHDFLRGQA